MFDENQQPSTNYVALPEVSSGGRRYVPIDFMTPEIVVGNKIRIIENSKSLPLKYEYFQVDALVFKNVDFNKVYLAHNKSGRKIALEFDSAKYFLLWTKPNAKYICLEPWCGIQDIENSSYEISEKEGIIKLGTKEVHSFEHTIEIIE